LTEHTSLNEVQSKQLFKAYNIPVVEERWVLNGDEAVHAARALGYPVVLKGTGAAWQHKTEADLVCLNLKDARAVRKAAHHINDMAGTELEGMVVQPHLSGRRELMAGLFRDPHFGPVMLFGLGGTLAEALDDVTMTIAPLSRQDALGMIDRLKAQKLLGRFRGEEKVDVEALVQVLLGLSSMAQDHPEIAEVDINPLKISPAGKVCAVDGLVVCRPVDALPSSSLRVSPETIGRLFHPRSIAFVGASSQIGKWGYMLAVNTIGGGFKGDIYLVNSKGGLIFGQTVYRSLEEVPGKIDLAVVSIPARLVPDLIPQLRSNDIRYMVLISSGFSETGPEGKALEEQVVSAARQAGILVLGPNTMGIANPHIALFCTGSSVSPLAGGTAMVSQSGNMGTQLLAFAEKQGIGIRGFSGSGNEAMIRVEDYLEGFETDELTRTVVLYVESIKDGRRFFQSARRVSRKKPIVLLKGGQTQAGSRAASSHTGALATDSRVFDAMCRQTGIIKVEQPMELLDLAAAFSSLPLPQGPRVAIMTLGGGWGVVTADLCHHHGLDIPELEPDIMASLDPLLPPYWSRSNPVDLVGEQDPDLPLKALEILAAWKGCDAVIHLGILGRRVFLERMGKAAQKTDPKLDTVLMNQLQEMLSQFERNYVQRTVQLMERFKKPIVGVHLLTDGEGQTVYRVKGSSHKGVFYETPERAVYALSKLVAYQASLTSGPVDNSAP
jgi:acyl-CoA synthetase (NDP forming)